MKKIFIYSIFFLSFFLVGFTNVNALDTSINFDINEYANYFYELKNDSSLYKYLNLKGVNIASELNSLASVNLSSRPYVISLFNKSELNSYGYVDEDYYYGIQLIYYDTIPARVTNYNNKWSLKTTNSYGRLYIFDSDMNYLSSFTGNNQSAPLSGFEFSNSEFTYLYSKIYYSNYDLYYYTDGTSYYSNPKVVVNNVILDDSNYIFSDSSFTTLWQKVKSIFTRLYSQPFLSNELNLFLEYYSKNVVISENYKFKNLFTTISMSSDSVALDSSYSYINLSNNSLGYYFVPKVISNSQNINNFNLYYLTSSSNSEISSSYFLINNSNNLIEDNELNYGGFNPTNLYSVRQFFDANSFQINTENNINNFILYYYTRTPRYDFNIYYNSEYYDVYSAGSSFSFTNINTNNPISFDLPTQSSVYSNMENDILDQESNIQSNNSSFFSDALNSISSLVSDLSDAFVLIGSLISIMFASFPPLIQSFFIAIISIGGIIIIIKLIRG